MTNPPTRNDSLATAGDSSAAPRASLDTMHRALQELEGQVKRGILESSEHIAAHFPEVMADKEAMLELVYTEHVLLQEQGREVSVERWIERFPQWREDIEALFQVHDYLNEVSHAPVGDTTAPSDAFNDWGQTSPDQADNRLGEYEILEQIGRGGMGVVYRARQVGLDRIVALKTIHQLESPSKDVLLRFRAEVDTIASLQHANIVQIYGAGISKNIPYFSMEYGAGGTLAQVIRAHPLPPEAAARLTYSLARAMQYAHEQGVVHRDLKPANVLLAASQRDDAIAIDVPSFSTNEQLRTAKFEPKLTDFGLAKRLQDDAQQTLPGATLGTPSYMAPEQAAHGGTAAGPAADIYSLGAILFDMLVGRPPFLAATPLETLERVKHDDPASIRGFQPHVPRDLELICLKCLHKDPARRYRSAGELADDLNRFLTGRPVQARPIGMVERLVKWSRRHPAAAAFVVALMFGALGVSWQWIRAEKNRRVAEKLTVAADAARFEEQAARMRAESTLYARDVSLAHHEFLSNNTDRALRLLDGTLPDFRNWEWDYLKRVCRPEFRNFGDLKIFVCCTALTQDGRLVAGGTARWGENYPDLIKVWNVDDGSLMWTLGEQTGSIMDLSFSPDGRLLASSTVRWQGQMPFGGIRVWSMTDGSLVSEITNWNAFSTCFSPDGKWLAIGDAAGRVHLWNVATKQIETTIRAHDQITLDLAWRYDSQEIASCSRDGTVKIHKIDGALRHTLSGLGDTRRVTWSSDGRELATGAYTGLVRVYRFEPHGPMEIARHDFGSVLGALEFTPDGKSLAVSSQFKSLRIIDPISGQVQREFHGHNGVTRDAGFDAAGMQMSSCGSDGNVKVWDMTHDSYSYARRLEGAHMIQAQFLDDNRAVLGMAFNVDRPGVRFDGKTIRIWDAEEQRIVGYFEGHSDWLTDMDLDTTRTRLLTGGLDGLVRLVDANSGRELKSWGPLESEIKYVSFVGQSPLVAALQSNGKLHIWRSDNGHSVMERQLPPSDLPVALVGCHRSNHLLLPQLEGQIQVINLDGDQGFHVIPSICDEDEIRRFAISPDDRWVALGLNSGKLLLCNLDHAARQFLPNSMQTIPAHTLPIESLRFSPDSSRLFTASTDTSIRIWDLHSGQQVMSLDGPTTHVCSLAISPNFDRILMANRTLIAGWRRHGDPQPRFADVFENQEHQKHWHLDQLRAARNGRRYGAVLFHFDALTRFDGEHAAGISDVVEAFANLQEFDRAREMLLNIPPERRSLTDEWGLALLSLRIKDNSEFNATCQRLSASLSSEHTSNQINGRIWPMALSRDLEVQDLLPWVDQMISGNPSADTLNTAGAIYYRAGNMKKAEELLQRAKSRRNSDMIVFDRILLAMIQASVGEHAKAQENLEFVEHWINTQETHLRLGRPASPLYTWMIRLELELLFTEAKEKM
ncbi:MAG TPA: protein kinase [Pirellulaceae bacterium]|nr:protein kinase [Pirellulaceae bacterium]